MGKPLLIIVTGRPGAGKTTLAKILAEQIRCPLLSRDTVKEGYLNTPSNAEQAKDAVALEVYNILFQTVDLLLSKRVSIIVEAAFQHPLWERALIPLQDKAQIRILLCTVGPEMAKTRFVKRVAEDPARKQFHGEGLEETDIEALALIHNYQAPHLDFPLLEVHTGKDYTPRLPEIMNFVREGSGG